MSELTGQQRTDVGNALVGLFKRYYGKGPERAKTFLNDEYLFVVLEGGLTRNEETLLRAGEEDLVRRYRLRYEEAVAQEAIRAVEDVVGRRVIAYHSQIVFEPVRSFEMFVLEDQGPA